MTLLRGLVLVGLTSCSERLPLAELDHPEVVLVNHTQGILRADTIHLEIRTRTGCGYPQRFTLYVDGELGDFHDASSRFGCDTKLALQSFDPTEPHVIELVDAETTWRIETKPLLVELPPPSTTRTDAGLEVRWAVDDLPDGLAMKLEKTSRAPGSPRPGSYHYATTRLVESEAPGLFLLEDATFDGESRYAWAGLGPAEGVLTCSGVPCGSIRPVFRAAFVPPADAPVR